MNPDPTLAVTENGPKDGVHLSGTDEKTGHEARPLELNPTDRNFLPNPGKRHHENAG